MDLMDPDTFINPASGRANLFSKMNISNPLKRKPMSVKIKIEFR